MLREHPGPCVQCSGPVKFISIQAGYERLCGRCSKKNSQLRGAANRKAKSLPAWNRGLTEETSESVRAAAQGCRDYIARHGHWRSGQTKENNEAVARAAAAISKTLSEKWQDERHWTQYGNTAETDERIKRRSEGIGSRVKETHWAKSSEADLVKRTIVETRRRLVAEGVNSRWRLDSTTIDERINVIKRNWAVDDFRFAGHQTPLNVTCVYCGAKDLVPFNVLYKGKLCSACYPANFSKWHRELYEFFTSLDHGATANNRKLIAPLELDIASSDCKFAIECNGLYWHSEATGVHPDYHQEKSTRALESGISLLHIASRL